MFLAGLDSVNHDVIFNIDYCFVESAPVGNQDQPAACAQQRLAMPANVATPADGLEAGTTYYWRVDTVRADGTVVKGEVWCFEAGEAEALDVPWNLRTRASPCARRNKVECAAIKPPTCLPGTTTEPPPSPDVDDPNWLVWGKGNRGCDWVAKRPEKRCQKQGAPNARTGYQACKKSCASTTPSTTSTSLTSSSTSPGGLPTTSAPACTDDVTWWHNQKKGPKSCQWVAEKPKKRCLLEGASDVASGVVPASVACQAACILECGRVGR